MERKYLAYGGFALITVILVGAILYGSGLGITGRAVASASCTDSDGGMIYHVKGTTVYTSATGAVTTKVDSCKNATDVMEWYCLSPTRSSQNTIKFCYGSSCQDGACLIPIVYPESCNDSDGGKVYDVKGTATGVQTSGIKSSSTDSCRDANTIIEYYCDAPNKSKISASITACGSGKNCTNGACVASAPAATCTDSDGGDVTGVKGTATSSVNGALTDNCSGLNSINEATCNAQKQAVYVGEGCSAGTTCSNGACVAVQVNCSDSDGWNLDVKGTCSCTNGTSLIDFCSPQVNNSALSEYTAFNGNCKETYTGCPAGKVCSNGACIVSAAPVVNCSDSDGGEVYGTKGTCTCTNGTTRTDTCSGTNLWEYAVYNGSKGLECALVYASACPSGQNCSNGACVAAGVTCTDSDGGNVTGVKGTITCTDGNVFTDACMTNALNYTIFYPVQEYYLRNNTKAGVTSFLYPCLNNTTYQYVNCSNGACP